MRVHIAVYLDQHVKMHTMCRARTTAWLGVVVVMMGTVQVRACGPDGLCASKQELVAALQSHIRNGPRDGWPPIGEWDVGLVTDVSRLFHGAASFNGNVSGWNVAGVTDMTGMFRHATSFDQDLSASWDVTGVSNNGHMFTAATAMTESKTPCLPSDGARRSFRIVFIFDLLLSSSS